MNSIYTIPFGFAIFPPIIEYIDYPDSYYSYDDYDDYDEVDYIELDEFNTTAFDLNN